jgi:hypothetical protein
MMVSTTDMAIQPNSESTTGMARSNKAPNSLRKRILADGCVTGAGENMILPTLIDPGGKIRLDRHCPGHFAEANSRW